MKKLLLIIAICFWEFIAYAQDLSIGLYSSFSNQVSNYIEESKPIIQKHINFYDYEYGIKIEYGFNETISLKMNIGISQKSFGLSDFRLPFFFYKAKPIGIRIKANLLRFSNFNIYIENGVSIAFCNSYSYNRVISASTSNLTGTISDYNFKNNWSYGFVNGLGISYRIKSKFEIDVFVNYYSGINKVWENNSILIVEDGVINNYTISSNGSSLNVGLGLGYCF